MYWSNWFKSWFIFAMACIVIMAASGGVLLFNLSTPEKTPPDYVVNQARVEVSDIMFLLEQRSAELSEQNGLRGELLHWSQQNDIKLVYAGLDGTVEFDSSAPLERREQKLDLKNRLHYDLYASKTQAFELAFPVIDSKTAAQVGNVIFTLPVSMLAYQQASPYPLLPILLWAASLLVLLLLLFKLRKHINDEILLPVVQLKGHSEAILRGDYEQKAEYGKQDEIGEVYAVFDQMRSEIMELSMQKEAQDKAQKELISNISHDLKTPLTVVKAYIDAIKDGVCPDLPAVMEYMDIIQTQANKMARLIEDLLVHALRDLGQISVNPVERYSREIFESIIKAMEPYIRTTGIHFIKPPEIPNVLIRIDPVRIEQLLSNLIANALKHTAPGDSIRITIVRQQTELKVTVSDTGEGILLQDMPFIFERYFQGQAPSQYQKRFKEGSGLGLSICKHIIEAHKGAIAFHSKKHQGSEFYFTLPLC